jgi:DNA-binding CsgD family transcriptional regulator
MGQDHGVPERAGALNETDVRAIVRLLGDVAGMDADQVAKRRRFMDGLAALVGADGWLWTMSRVLVDQNTPVSVGVIHGGLTDEQLAAWVESSQQTSPALPEHEPLTALAKTGRHFTRTRQQLVSDGTWYRHPTVKKYRIDVGLDHFLYTIYPVKAPEVISAIGLYRRVGAPPFSDRDRRITHIVTSEIGWLHSAGLPADAGHTVPQLTRKQRAVLVLLLDGHGRKQIASLLHITPNTAKDHIEAVYRHFGVSSQVELLRRFSAGDGGDSSG